MVASSKNSPQVFSGKIRIGTRTSKLALAQVQEVQDLLAAYISHSQIEIIHITTSGDKIQDRNLAEVGGKGLFIKELEEALLQNRIDIAVHSAKDVPPVLALGTEIAAFSKRKDARDYFISSKYTSIEQLPQGAIVGTSSSRRKSLLLRLRPDLKVVNFRGNVDGRLAKVERQEVDASILAVCGLKRLGKEIISERIIEKNVMLPSGGQGAIAIQVKSEDVFVRDLLGKINDRETMICVKAERSFLRSLGASCHTPVAVYAEIENGLVRLKSMIIDYDGNEVFEYEATTSVDLGSSIELGDMVAQVVKQQAAPLLKKII